MRGRRAGGRRKRRIALRGGGLKGQKSGQDSQVGAIGKGNEANKHTPHGDFKSKIKMWISRCHPAHSDTQASLGGGVQDPQITLKAAAEQRSHHVHPWLKNTAVP